jgi:hypothetical protein
MKFCPHCGQQIQNAALKCPHCKNWLVTAGVGGEAFPPGASVPYLRTSGLAIASMVLGILWIYWIGSIVALILGYLALREIRQSPHAFQGKGMATAGIILGWVGVATLLLAIVIGLYAWKNEQHPSSGQDRAARIYLANST